MLGLNCLINDTSVANDIKDAIQLVVGERLEAGKGISFPQIYNDLRKEGLEVDAESAGSLYNEVYGGYNDSALSTEAEIEKYVGRDVVNQQNAIVDSILSGEQAVNENQIGNLPPEKQVATMIAKMFQEFTFGATQNVNTVMKQMETLVSRAARTLLPATPQKASKTLFQNLNDFFDTEKQEFQTLSGGVNTLKTLHTAVKTEVDNYLQGATEKLTDEEAQDLTDKWQAYTNGFIQSTYDLMLGKTDQNKLLNEALKQIKVDGLNVVDVNGNVKWSALMANQDPKKIGDGVKKLFEDGVKDDQGVVHNYSREEASRIGDYFQRLYDKKLAAVGQQKIGNERSKNASAKNLVSDFIKDRGFVNLVKDKNGKLLLTQANWDAALKHMMSKVGDKKGIDVAVKQLRDFLGKIKTKEGNDYTPQQIDIVEQEFRSIVAAKQVPGTAVPAAMERLIALNELNGGKAFDQSTQFALNKVLGVSGLDQNTINEIQKLTQVAQSIISGNNVNGSTSSSPSVNRGAYAFQALSQINRRIKEIIRENKIERSWLAQRSVKYVGDLMNAASTSLLLNPGNFGENIATGFASNLGESVNMLFTHPKLFTKFGGDFWTAFGSHISGGVANEVIAEQDITADVQSGERLRFRGAVNEFKDKGWTAALSVMLKIPAYAVSIVSRTLMNSFDAGFNSSILRKKAVTSMYNALRSQGLSSKEVLDSMSEALSVSKANSQEIETLNNEIMAKLKSVGLTPTIADKEQNRRDLMLSLYEDSLGKAALKNGEKTTPRQIAEGVKALIDSSQLQAKILTGKKPIPVNENDPLNSLIYGFAEGTLSFQRKAFQSQQKLEEEGKLAGAAGAQFKAEILKNTIARFVGGIANFLALAATATPYGFITANSLRTQKNRLLNQNPDAADILKADPGEVRRYAEYHNLMRSMVLRASLGTLVISGFIAKKLAEDDDDEDDTFVSNLMQTKSGRRMLQKYLPLGVNVAASFLYDVKDKKMDTKMERLIDVLGNTTGQSYDKWSGIKTAFQRAKTDDDRWKAGASFFGGNVPTLNINQPEQITKFAHVLKSAYDKKYISDVKRDEGISSSIYKNAEDGIDIIMANGMFEGLGRIIEGEKFNRYSRDKK